MQFVGAGEEGKPEEVGKLEVDEEVDSKKKLDQREKELQKQLWKIDEFPDGSRGVVDEYKEKWQQELQDIEQRMIFRWSIKKCRKNHKSCKACKTERISARRIWPHGLETVRRPRMKSKKGLCDQKIEKTSMAEAELDEEIRILQNRR